MEYAAKSGARIPADLPDPQFRIVPGDATSRGTSSGIHAVDERLGRLEKGGVYLFVGSPGPSKMVAALQFLHQGILEGERGLLVTSSEAESILEVARAWGFDFGEAWSEGLLQIVGFREDFEMRALRSAEPAHPLEELSGLAAPDLDRIAVDPGSLLLKGGTRTLLGRAFLGWARKHPATVVATLSVDSEGSLPSTSEWVVHATTGVFLFEKRPDGLQQVSLQRPLPGTAADDGPVTLQLAAGRGLFAPEQMPGRRRSDRPAGDPDRVLLLSLVDSGTADLEAWVRGAFRADVVGTPLEAVDALRGEVRYGSVLVHMPRMRIRDAEHACRAIRPLTAAAIVVASDDAIRSTDRVAILESGADDCLSGGIHFQELEARLGQAARAGGKSADRGGTVRAVPTAPLGGIVEPDVLSAEADRRRRDPTRSVFSVIELTARSATPEELIEALSREVRAEEGDLLARTSEGCLILLQGARREPSKAFLARGRSGLEARLGRDPGLGIRVAAHPAEAEAVREMLSKLGDAHGTSGFTQ